MRGRLRFTDDDGNAADPAPFPSMVVIYNGGAGEGVSDKKKCPFCEAIALQRFIEEHHSKPAGFGMALSAALVSYAVVNGRKCGRTTDYMKDGKGFPLNYCPSCGKRVKNE